MFPRNDKIADWISRQSTDLLLKTLAAVDGVVLVQVEGASDQADVAGLAGESAVAICLPCDSISSAELNNDNYDFNVI